MSAIHAMMACAYPKLQVRLGDNQMPTCLVALKVALDRWWEACRASCLLSLTLFFKSKIVNPLSTCLYLSKQK